MIQVYSHSEAGGHVHNEDAFDVKPHPSDPMTGQGRYCAFSTWTSIAEKCSWSLAVLSVSTRSR